MLYSLLFVYFCVCYYTMNSSYNLYCRSGVVKVQLLRMQDAESGVWIHDHHVITLQFISILSLVIHSAVRAKPGKNHFSL